MMIDPHDFTYEIDPDEICSICGSDLEWEDCYNGCDDDDPLWYDENDVEACDACHGNGGWWICPNAHNHQ